MQRSWPEFYVLTVAMQSTQLAANNGGSAHITRAVPIVRLPLATSFPLRRTPRRPVISLDLSGTIADDFGWPLLLQPFTVSGLSKAVANALRKKAERRGVTVDAYIKDLIAEDVELDRVARTKSFWELAMPFQRALASLSESDLDALARPPRGKAKR